MNIVECSFYVGHTNQGRNKACESNVSIGNIWHESKDTYLLVDKEGMANCVCTAKLILPIHLLS